MTGRGALSLCQGGMRMTTDDKDTSGFRREMSRRHLLQLGALGAAAAAIPFSGRALAATEPDADLIAAAKADGTLTYYHTTAIDITATWTSA